MHSRATAGNEVYARRVNFDFAPEWGFEPFETGLHGGSGMGYLRVGVFRKRCVRKATILRIPRLPCLSSVLGRRLALGKSCWRGHTYHHLRAVEAMNSVDFGVPRSCPRMCV